MQSRDGGAPVAVAPEPDEPPADTGACQAVCIGASTGGPAALKAVLPKLAANFPVPVLVIQHMPAQYTRSLAKRLDSMCAVSVCEAESGMALGPGMAVVAPGGQQMKIVKAPHGARIEVTDDPHENACKPSVDYTLRSCVSTFDGQILAVILTGMGRDGADGCAEVRRRGGRVIAHHQDGCVVYGMPKAVVDADLAHRILPLERIAAGITRHVKQSNKN